MSVTLYRRTTKKKKKRSECKNTMRLSVTPVNFRPAGSIVQLERDRVPKIELE